MSKLTVMKKRGFSEMQYRAFARSVGYKIDFSRKVNQLASYLDCSAEELQQVDHSARPIELILEYADLIGIPDLSDEGIIAEEIYSTTEQSFRRFGDIKKLTDQIRGSYLDDLGQPLDIQASMINESYSKDLTEDDLVDFMYSYPGGPSDYVPVHEQKMDDISNEIYDLVGFYLHQRFVLDFKIWLIYPETTVDKKMPF